MIILKLKGGLGNQMFQYAAARSMAIDTNDEIVLNIEALTNSRKNHEIYTLDKLNINSKIDTIITDKIYLTLKQKIIYKILDSRIINYISYKVPIVRNCFEETFQKILNKNGFYLIFDKYIPLNISNIKSKVFIGYFQSNKFFEKNSDIIRKELLVKEKPTSENQKIINKMISSNSVCVHIRRGDYVQLKNYNVCNIEYYLKGIEIINSKIDNPEFYIFSDDSDWVKKNIDFKIKVNYIDSNNASYQDLQLMYNCKHFIISNSSFSWWAQYLSNYKSKIVISPNTWYRNPKQSKDLILDDFIKIEVDEYKKKKKILGL